MEYNLNNNRDENVTVREQDNDATVWYIVIGLVVLGLIGWYGYSAGWFGTRDADNNIVPQTQVDNNQFDLGEVPANAAPIDSLSIESSDTFPVQKVVVIKGTLPNGCVFLNNPSQIRDGNVFYVTLDTRTEEGECTQALVPYEEKVTLPVNGLPAGVYVVNVNGREITFELESDNKINFNAGSDK